MSLLADLASHCRDYDPGCSRSFFQEVRAGGGGGRRREEAAGGKRRRGGEGFARGLKESRGVAWGRGHFSAGLAPPARAHVGEMPVEPGRKAKELESTESKSFQAFQPKRDGSLATLLALHQVLASIKYDPVEGARQEEAAAAGGGGSAREGAALHEPTWGVDDGEEEERRHGAWLGCVDPRVGRGGGWGPQGLQGSCGGGWRRAHMHTGASGLAPAGMHGYSKARSCGASLPHILRVPSHAQARRVALLHRIAYSLCA